MKAIAYRAGLAAFGALIVLIIDATVEKLLFPGVSIIAVHLISVLVSAAVAFFLLLYAAPQGNALGETQRQPGPYEAANHLLVPLLATMQEGILVVNPHLDIVLYNDAAANIVKLPLKERCSTARSEQLDSRFITSDAPAQRAGREGLGTLLGQRPRLTEATRDPSINDAFRDVLNQRIAVETRVELMGRKPRVFHLRVTPLDAELAAGVFFDITQVERLERVRREFFANLSHELRTPLTAILAYAETLQASSFDDPGNSKRFMEKLHKHAIRMTKLISDISDLSEIESGRMNLSLEPVRLRGVVTDMIALIEARRQNCSVSFGVSVPEDLSVQADRTRLEQVLSNLIDNAVKFNRPGGLVTVKAERNGNIAAVVIEDTGIGVAASDLPRIFERLYRADKSRSNRIEGTGLGLAIVKHLVQAHGGELTATSELGRGSRFAFTIAVAAPAEKPTEVIEAELSAVEA
jgi:two-component system, OmpR family, phosphate regulon sensor histidine kinase PhoR